VFDNNSMSFDNADKLYELRPLSDSLNSNYEKLYDVSHYE